MTIGIDCRLYSPRYTGIGRYVFEFIKHLEALDRINHFILYFNQEEFDAFEVPNQRWQKKLVNIPHYSLAEQTRWYWFLKNEPVDLMYFPHFNAPFLYTKPFIVTIHDLTLHYFPYKEYKPRKSLRKMIQIWVYKFIMGRTVKHAQKIIAVSENTRRDLIQEYNLDSNKITTIYEGVPEEFHRPTDDRITATRQKYGVSKPYLIYSGVWRSHKNLLRLIEAFRKLIDQGNDLQLIFTGKKDADYPEIPALIEELKLTDRIVLTGFVSDQDLVNLTSGAKVFVFPSLYEGFGLPPLEAMQLKVPVACSNTSSLPEVVGEAAITFDPRNIDEMASKIGGLLNNEQLQRNLIQKGLENVRKFSWKVMSGEILDLLVSVCNNTSQKGIRK